MDWRDRGALSLYIFSLSALACILGCGGTREEAPPGESDPVPEEEPQAEKVATKSIEEEIDRLSLEVGEAMDVQDWPRARQLIGQGLELVSGKPGLERHNAGLLLKLGDIERETGNEPEARRHYTDAMAIFHVHKNHPGRFETFLAMGRLEARRGDSRR
jgi:hypothetical protein